MHASRIREIHWHIHNVASEIAKSFSKMQGEENYLGKEKWMIHKDSINTSLVGVEEVHCLCPATNSNLHHTRVNDVNTLAISCVKKWN